MWNFGRGKMKILIIGGTSTLARSLNQYLSNNHKVITAGRNSCDIQFDLNDEVNSDLFPKNIDVVIHVAATFGGKTYNDFTEAINTNVIGTLKVCQLSKDLNVNHLIIISSIFASLNDTSKFYSQYSVTKKHAEEIARLFCNEFNVDLTILRPSQIYGKSNNFAKHQPFFYHMLDNAKNGKDIYIYGNNDPLRNYIYVDDLNKIIILTIEKKALGTFYCGNMQDIHYSEIAETFLHAYNNGGELKFLIDKDDILDNIFEKDNKLYEKINYYPSTTLSEAINNLIKEEEL